MRATPKRRRWRNGSASTPSVWPRCWQSADASLAAAADALRRAVTAGIPADDLLDRFAERERLAAAYRQAYRRYCGPVSDVNDLRLAPFHLLATEGRSHLDRDHAW